MEIKDLPKELVEVLYWRCQGGTPKQIADRLVRSESSYYEYQRKALKILGYSTWKEFEEKKGCNALLQYTEEDIKNWERSVHPTPNQSNQPTQPDQPPQPTQPDHPDQPPPPPQSDRSSQIPVVALVIIGVLLILLFLGRRFLLSPTAVPTAEVIIQTVIQTPIATLVTPIPTPTTPNTPQPTPEPTLETPPPEIVAVISSPVPTALVQPDTPRPTDTLAPTVSSTTPPTLIPLGFEDDFSDGLSEEWEVLSGEPLILDQAFLTPQGNDLFIAFGDPGWTDYEVEIGIEAAICGTEHGNFIALRMAGNHFIALAFSGCGGSFWEFEGNNWRQIPGSAYDNPGLRGETVRAVVRQNEVVAYVRGLQVKSITTTFPEGRVGLKIIKGTKITFFSVKELQP